MLAKESSDQKIYTISELNRFSRNLLESELFSVWVEGEVSSLAKPSSGHLYFSLKDANAQIRCALFSARRRLGNVVLENGLRVLAKGKVSLYETRGDFQLIIDTIEIAGYGKLQQAFEKLKAMLLAEGLFANVHKKPLPHLPQVVGVVTSKTGAAIRDILSVLKRRFPAISVIIYPTLVQGQQASEQIANAIEIANRHRMCDVLVVARGGGSLEDLWSFNEERVARAIFASEIPIVSAVGHEIDFTIADFVADVRAPTPSVAAELISPDQAQWLDGLEESLQQLNYAMQKNLAQQQQNVLNLSKRLRHPREILQNRMQQLDQLEQILYRTQQRTLQKKQQQLANLSEKINTLSPLKTLQRGYAIVNDVAGHVIESVQELAVGELMDIRLSDGKIRSRIEALM